MKMISSLLTLAASLLLLGSSGSVEAYDSKASYYNDRGFGSCGAPIDAGSELLVALPPNFWTSPNPNADPICNAQIRVTYNGNSLTLPVRDKCPSCTNNKIDLSEQAFKQLAGDLGIGIINVHWEIIGGGSSSSTGGITQPPTSGSPGCSGKSATVDAGQGCWDVWTSKCGNAWNENQFFAANPGVSCGALRIGQSLCCGSSNGAPSSTSGFPSTSNGSCSKSATVDAGQGCWDVWTSKCGNAWNENQFFAANPGVSCGTLRIGQSLCCN